MTSVHLGECMGECCVLHKSRQIQSQIALNVNYCPSTKWYPKSPGKSSQARAIPESTHHFPQLSFYQYPFNGIFSLYFNAETKYHHFVPYWSHQILGKGIQVNWIQVNQHHGWRCSVRESNWILRGLDNNYDAFWQNCNFIVHLYSNYKC